MVKTNDVVFYQTENADVVVNVVYKDETFWLTQKAMAALFDCSVDNISLHLKNIFSESELDKNSVTEDFSITAAEIVYNRADSRKEHMGLTTWKNSPDGKIYESDVISVTIRQ